MDDYGDMAYAERRTEKSAETIRRWMRAGIFPRPTHRRGRRLYWLKSEIDAAINRLSCPVPIASKPEGAA